ncbi:hypothetical protein MIMGU_mgv1a019779mg, partial [Erythranthe guttata]
MECNKEEAMRAKQIAETKMEKHDFEGARKIVMKAQKLYPKLETLNQMVIICEVICSAQKSSSNLATESDNDWYGILQIEKLSDELTVRKQYRRLALSLHPDKNRFPGAEAAFKLISQAYEVLSDPKSKSLYDGKIKNDAGLNGGVRCYNGGGDAKSGNLRNMRRRKRGVLESSEGT